MSKETIKTASVLAFERKLAVSDGIFRCGQWARRSERDRWAPIPVREKDVRGTISNRLKSTIASDPLKLDAEIQKPNLQTVDVCNLPMDADTLQVSFTLRVLGGIGTPTACNDQRYQEVLCEKVKGYYQEFQFSDLSLRYAENIASGRFLWRNRIGAEAVEVRVALIENNTEVQQWLFNGYDFNLNTFGGKSFVEGLAEVIRKGLAGDSFVLLHIEAFARLGVGQEVFPSQELILDKGGKDKKSKFLYQVDGVAAMHSQKIGNALRTIDTWYPEGETRGPIAVEPYGSVTSRGIAYRQPKEKNDFYNLFDDWIVKSKTPSVDQQHFVIACLIRGGVYGEKGE
jgi:CRISPR-associated protein Csy3